MTAEPSLTDLLDAAVAAVGGRSRPGQVAMAQAVADAVDSGEHLLVQAGTGTGKSLAYLVPALALAQRQGQGDEGGSAGRVVIATATLALQRQLIERDLPRTVAALHPLLGRRAEFAILKGRSNYVCLHRIRDGVPSDESDGLFDPMLAAGGPTSKLGKDLVRLRDWAEDGTETGDRDALTPGVSDRAWSQVSVSSRECLGASKCPYAAECFAEAARDLARLAEVVVTNHAMLAIDAMDGATVLPKHQVLIVDEAHELVSRVTAAATGELTPFAVNRAVKRAAKLAPEKAADALETAAEGFEALMDLAEPARLVQLPEDLSYGLAALRDACRQVITSLGEARDRSAADEEAVRKQALASVESIHGTAERVLGGDEDDVVWLERHARFGATLRVAPLNVAQLLRDRLFEERSVILTSATLKLGGDFSGIVRAVGLAGAGEAASEEDTVDDPPFQAVDVGSPFNYRKQGILYIARHLSQPGREGTRVDMHEELAELIEAAGGRTLGLFSSMRAAQAAAEELRDRLEQPILLQGEDTLGELIRDFASDASTCLFGTLSLWQGVDVPGSACQLVVMDRIPFPRPDDPLMSARQRAVAEAGGNGFMAVAATHAALLLAQGSGRLIRSLDDLGVVAVLDPRLATARYGEYLRASMPDFWCTTDRDQVRRSLAAINAAAADPRPVPGPA